MFEGYKPTFPYKICENDYTLFNNTLRFVSIYYYSPQLYRFQTRIFYSFICFLFYKTLKFFLRSDGKRFWLWFFFLFDLKNKNVFFFPLHIFEKNYYNVEFFIIKVKKSRNEWWKSLCVAFQFGYTLLIWTLLSKTFVQTIIIYKSISYVYAFSEVSRPKCLQFFFFFFCAYKRDTDKRIIYIQVEKFILTHHIVI